MVCVTKNNVVSARRLTLLPAKWPRFNWQILTPLLMLASFLLSLLHPQHVQAQSITSSSPDATAAVSWPALRFETLASDFSEPINLVSANDGTNRLFVVEKGGRIQIIENGERLPTPFLDISDRVARCSECGLLGLAFPPNFAQEGYFFVNYTSEEDFVGPETDDDESPDIGDTVIARFRITGNPNVANALNEERVLVINQPETNHNGGHIVFGPDDYLYIGMGDGGGGGDPFRNAQDPASLLGKMLRIAVSGTATYTVPADNPFVDVDGYRDEIWATGLRNPWRFSFDRVTGDLYIADVGQGNIEEVNHVAAADIENGGMNFGWPNLEGNNCYPPDGPTDCGRIGVTDPVTTYTHELGDCSVTGGYVYDSALPNQGPIYLYGDYCSGRVWGLQPDGEAWATSQLADLTFQITSFGEDADGNVYVVSFAGDIYQVFDAFPERYFLPALSTRP